MKQRIKTGNLTFTFYENSLALNGNKEVAHISKEYWTYSQIISKITVMFKASFYFHRNVIVFLLETVFAPSLHYVFDIEVEFRWQMTGVEYLM